MFEWSFAGINTSLPGAGGDDCVNYLPASQRLLETLTITGVFAYLSIWALPRLTFPAFILPGNSNPMRQGLLVIHCIVFGIELGFKCATGSLLWALNPCHILTVLQIIMLACQPSHLVTLLFRLQMHMLNGPLLALAFPVLNTRQVFGFSLRVFATRYLILLRFLYSVIPRFPCSPLPFEWTVYFIQHLLLLLIPVLMLDQTTVYSVEPLDDVSWSVLALSLQILYHFLILQPIALLTGINLNHMLCPAITDPFAGPNYRLMAMVHQPSLILILGKCISCFGLSWSSSPWPWQTSLMMMCPSKTDTSNSSSSSVTSNPGKLRWLNSEPESEMMTLAATPWCWSDLFRYQTYVCDRQLPGKSANYSTGKEVPKHEHDPELSPVDEVCRRTSSS